MQNSKLVLRLLVLLAFVMALTACGSDDAATAGPADDVATTTDGSALLGADAVGGDAADDAAPSDDAAAEDAATDAQSDVAYSDAPFETASHYTLPQLVYGGVDVLHHPHIVTVTFAGEQNADQFEQFAAQLQTTKWWDAWSVGYCSSTGKCIGKGDTDKVRLGASAAKSYTDSTAPGGASTIQQFLKSHIDSAELPAPVTDTLYVVYFPQGTKIALASGGGQPASNSCQAWGGYHHSMAYGSGKIAYAIIPECKWGDPGMTQVENSLFTASHEISEAATDPFSTATTTGSPYGGFNINVMDENVLAWVFALGGGEVADLCPSQYVGYAEENGYKLARVWSNIAVKANHNPCVPADPGPYFNAAPEKNKGTHVKLELGASATIALHAFSDVAVKAWTLTAVDLGTLMGAGSNPALTFDFDGQSSVSVNNGDVINVTITRNYNAQGVMAIGNVGAIGVIVSTSSDGQTSFYWPIWSYTAAEIAGG